MTPVESLIAPGRTCTVAGCDGKHMAKGYCMKHYYSVRRYGRTYLVREGNWNAHRPFSDRTCDLPGCEAKHYALSLCYRHWRIARRMQTSDTYSKQLALNLFPVEPLVAEIERVHISHKELARRSHVPRRTIQRVVNEQRHVTANVADLLCYALGIHPISMWDDWIRFAA